MAKFNFLALRTELVKTEVHLQRQFPRRSLHRIGGTIQRAVQSAGITTELQAPGQFWIRQRRSR